MINYKQLEARIRQANKEGKNVSIGCGEGVILIATKGGGTFYLRIVDKNRRQIRTRLGEYPQLSLAAARAKARELLAEHKKQQEEAQKEAEKPCPKFGEFIDQWIETKKDGKNNRNFINLTSLRRHLSALDDMRLDEIRPDDICRVLDGATGKSGKPLTQCVKFTAVQKFNQAMKYAINRGYIQSNPCAYLASSSEGIFKKPQVKGFAYVMPEELHAQFFARLSYTAPHVRLILLYIAMSCARLGEALNLRWSWIDFDKKVITVPAEFMKMRRPHTIPLTPQLELVLNAYASIFPKNGDLVFYAPQDHQKPLPLWGLQNPVMAVCKGIATIHGLRKTARTWLASKAIPFEVAEACLAHEEKSAVVRAYQKYTYLEERRPVLAQWDAFILDGLPAAYCEGLNLNLKEAA